MEEHDDWKLGDEGDSAACTRCGKRNRPGLSHCAICGTRLGDELEGDTGSLRTIGETMGRPRPARGGSPRRHSLRAWTISAVVLLLIVAVLTWLETRETPFRLEDLTEPTAAIPVSIAPTATVLATRVVAPTVRAAVPTPARAVVPPQPTALRASPPPAPRPTAARIVVPPPPIPAPVATPVRAAATEPPAQPPPVETRPQTAGTEKPSLGSDLQEATRAYRQAVDVHNERVDEYNALADEIQRRDAWDDREESVALRRRLDRAREDVESSRAHAETLRARMESIRARYR